MSIEKNEKYQFLQIIQRLMEALKLSTEYKLAELLGFNRDTFSARKKRGAVPVDKIRLLCRDRGINFNWVVTGQGEMFEAGKEAGRVAEPSPDYSGLDPLDQAFLNDWHKLTDVEKLRFWTMLKEAMEKKK